MKKLTLGLLLIISLNSFSQQQIFATIAGGDLYSFDITNCTRQFIGSTGLGFGDIAFTPNGQLWGIVDGFLYNIDPTNASVTLVGNTELGAVTLVGLNDSTLLTELQTFLYGINTSDGSSYYIGEIGYAAAGDLTWYDDNLYLVSPLVKIELNDVNSAIVNVTPINLSLPACEGAVTASFNGDYHSILGFNASDLLKICQIDGSYQVLCPDLNFGGTPGAASIRLATQNPQPTNCSQLSTQEVFSTTEFSVFPNPAINQLNIQTNYQKPFNYTIYNSIGQLLQTGILKPNGNAIFLDRLIEGIYYIELLTDDEKIYKEFVVGK